MDQNVRKYGIALFAIALLWSCSASIAAELSWGINGKGGEGRWLRSDTNWWDGTKNVVWSGGTAVFSGTGGTVFVTSGFPALTADALVFEVSGYSIVGGSLQGGTQGLTITTNAPAMISTALLDLGYRPLIKEGPTTLTVAGPNDFRKVEVREGEYRVAGNSTLFFSDVVLSDAPGVLVTLARENFNSVEMRSLSGGGVVQPDAQARTMLLRLFNRGTFHGTLQDNGVGKLALDVFSSGSLPVTLSGTNTYSGATTVHLGTLRINGGGSISNSALTIHSSGTLQLDNTGTVHSNRISDSSDFALQGGRLQLFGGATPVNERIGSLKYSGASNIDITITAGVGTELTLSSGTRLAHATLHFTGNGGVVIEGLANQSSSLLAPYIVHGTDWVQIEAGGRLVPFSGYATDLNTASADANVKLSGGTTSLLGSTTRNSVNLSNTTAEPFLLEIGAGNTLTLTGGGLLSSGAGPSRIQGGTLSTPAGEFLVTNFNSLTITSAIHSSTAGTGLTKSGAGTLTLEGVNTFPGNVAITEGVLEVSSDSNLGTGPAIEFNGGTLRATGDFSSAKELISGEGFAGIVDTNGYSVVFSSSNSAGILKIGEGTLTLSQRNVGKTTLASGTLNLPNISDGEVNLQTGSLLVAGTLAYLALEWDGTLDIGGPAAVSLLTEQLELSSSQSRLTINFGIGANASDLWRIKYSRPSPFVRSQAAFLFNFHDLGDLTTGKDYALIEFASAPDFSPNIFAIAPDLVERGWSGTFKVTNSQVTVNFNSVPEPSVLVLALAGLGWAGLCRPSRQRMR